MKKFCPLYAIPNGNSIVDGNMINYYRYESNIKVALFLTE